MTQSSHKLIQGLWPLPGGNSRYLNTLDQIVKWVASQSDLAPDELASWLMTQYNVGKGTISGYLQVMTKLGAIAIQGERVTIGPLGLELLDAQGEFKARKVIDRFMQDYLAFPEVLGFYAEIGSPVHLNDMFVALQPRFSQWTSPAQFEYRALWLLSLGCLQQVRGRTYEITNLGKNVAVRYPPSREASAQEILASEVVMVPQPALVSGTAGEKLIAELEAATTDSQNPQRLERVVAEAFEFLGFTVDQLGDSGDTDVLVRANIGPESYSVVVDAKARRDGKLQDLEAYTLQDHLAKNEGTYAVVVAGRFASGKIARHAENSGIVLLSVALLSEWLRLHERTPLNLSEYRSVFTKPGSIDGQPPSLKSASDKRLHWAHLLVDLVELIQETYAHGLSQSLPASQLFAMLVTRLRGVRYSSKEVRDAIDLLGHPAIGAVLGDGESGIALAVSRSTLVRTLRALADQIESAEAEIEA